MSGTGGISGRHCGALLVLAFFTGVLLLSYPSVSNYWNEWLQSRAVQSYAQAIGNLDAEEYQKLIDDAVGYNQELAVNGFDWDPEESRLKEYYSLLNVDGTGNMGYINIPKINLKLPLYHGVSKELLETSIGHLEATSLPVGGRSTHCVLSGHRGLPSAKLFTDLDKLIEGDTFTLNILNETLTYEVDQVRVVLPTDFSELSLNRGEDLVTLVTCTPYGVNTHRLLVRGKRIENAQGEARVIADGLQLEPEFVAPLLAIPTLVLLLVIALMLPPESPSEQAMKAWENRKNGHKDV